MFRRPGRRCPKPLQALSSLQRTSLPRQTPRVAGVVRCAEGAVVTGTTLNVCTQPWTASQLSSVQGSQVVTVERRACAACTAGAGPRCRRKLLPSSHGAGPTCSGRRWCRRSQCRCRDPRRRTGRRWAAGTGAAAAWVSQSEVQPARRTPRWYRSRRRCTPPRRCTATEDAGARPAPIQGRRAPGCTDRRCSSGTVLAGGGPHAPVVASHDSRPSQGLLLSHGGTPTTLAPVAGSQVSRPLQIRLSS